MKKYVRGIAIAALTMGLAITGTTGVASALAVSVSTDDGVSGVTFTPEETQFIARTPIPDMLGFLPSGAAVEDTEIKDLKDVPLLTPESSRRTFNNAVANGEVVGFLVTDPQLFDGKRFVVFRDR